MKNLFKILALILSLFVVSIACSTSDDGDGTTNDDGGGVNTDYDITAILSKFEGTGLSYAVNGNTVTFTTQDLPNHTSPYYPTTNPLYEAYNGTNPNFNLNPNEIAAQNIVFTITLNPTEATTHQATSLGPIGVSRNGVVFFNQYAAGNSPLTNEINSFDQWLGHPQNIGMYHYHIEPTYLTQQFGEHAFLGLLADGFPVYGPVENGETLSSSDLDEFHGHTSATEDFPEGIYHYHITADDPYINGNGYYGTPGNISN